MLWTAVILFAIAAIGGIVLASNRMSEKPLPLWLSIAHGIIGVLGVVLVLITVINIGAATLLIVSLLLFVIAAILGLVMLLNYHLKGRLLPTGLMFGHAAAALIAAILVLIFVL